MLMLTLLEVCVRDGSVAWQRQLGTFRVAFVASCFAVKFLLLG